MWIVGVRFPARSRFRFIFFIDLRPAPSSAVKRPASEADHFYVTPM
jgi:hypothetical protein